MKKLLLATSLVSAAASADNYPNDFMYEANIVKHWVVGVDEGVIATLNAQYDSVIAIAPISKESFSFAMIDGTSWCDANYFDERQGTLIINDDAYKSTVTCEDGHVAESTVIGLGTIDAFKRGAKVNVNATEYTLNRFTASYLKLMELQGYM
uniref:hypothetical protein n=1 Tax=Thaumasiovibrio occultus TaxID=1891184 RepID=UPI000B359AE9|nr:hypothetical protein [Thaumasiovibrio occultus]